MRHNANIIAKFGKYIFTHSLHDSQVWLEAATSKGPNRNQVYGLLISLARELST